MSIATWLVGKVVDTAMGPVFGLVDKYLSKEISRQELEAQLRQEMVKAAATVETTYAQELTKGFQSFIGAAKDNRMLSLGWAFVLYSQTTVLLWHQMGIPFYVWYASTDERAASWPLSGSTVDWAYALVALCLGGGAIALKMQGGGGVVQSLKSLARLR